jgi:hypothetical protein
LSTIRIKRPKWTFARVFTVGHVSHLKGQRARWDLKVNRTSPVSGDGWGFCKAAASSSALHLGISAAASGSISFASAAPRLESWLIPAQATRADAAKSRLSPNVLRAVYLFRCFRADDRSAQPFHLPAKKQEQAADGAIAVPLEQLSFDPEVEKTKAEFDRAQSVNEKCRHDFERVLRKA